MARFDYSIKHVPGKLLDTADTLSRAPSADKYNDVELQKDAEWFVEVVTLPATNDGLLQYHRAKQEDQLCTTIPNVVRKDG